MVPPRDQAIEVREEKGTRSLLAVYFGDSLGDSLDYIPMKCNELQSNHFVWGCWAEEHLVNPTQQILCQKSHTTAKGWTQAQSCAMQM